MFTKDNILFVRYANPQNDTIYIEYGAEENVNVYYMPVLPLDSYEWQILSEADYDLEKVYVDTVEWIKNPQPSKYKNETLVKTKSLVKLRSLPNADLQVSWQDSHLIFSADVDQKLYEKDPNFDIAITEKNNPLMVHQSVHVDLPSTVWKQHKVKVDIPYFSNYSLYTFGNNLSFTLSHQK